VIIGGAALAILVGVVIGLGPVRGNFQRIAENIEGAEGQVRRNLKILTPSAKSAVLAGYTEYGEIIKKKGSSAEENAAMMSEIEKIASGVGVTLSATKPREPVIDKESERYEVDLEVEAEMESIIRFLHAVESSSQVLIAETLTIDSAKTAGTGSLKASFRVSKVVTL
jgi:Tfp pilus assembly protein PilO